METYGMLSSGFGVGSQAAVRVRPSMPFMSALATALPIAPVPAMPIVRLSVWILFIIVPFVARANYG